MDFVQLCRNMNIVDGPEEYVQPKNVGLMFFNPEPYKRDNRDSYFLEVKIVKRIFLLERMNSGTVCQLNNSDTFSRKPMGSEEFLIQMVEVLGIIIDRHPKGRPRKMESQTIEKIGCVVPF